MTLKTNKTKPKTNQLGFTIVELLVVIVVIGILAAITIVSYTGITVKANESSIKSELANASKKLSMYYAQYESYPTTSGLNLTTGCPTLPNDDTNYCIKFNSGTIVTYKSDNSQSYDLTFTKNNLTFTVSQSGTIAAGTPAPTLPESDWITIGTQRWARKNLNVGTMIAGVAEQTDNSGTNIIEKWCYDNDEANCIIYGGLYKWSEAMKYSVTEGSQGICPASSHIPTDNEWKALERFLGMGDSAANATGWRGTNQGTQLKINGTSSLNIPLGGFRHPNTNFGYIGTFGHLWTSTQSGASGMQRAVVDYQTDVGRNDVEESRGLSVRCLSD